MYKSVQLKHEYFKQDGIDSIVNTGKNVVYLFKNNILIKYTIDGGIFTNKNRFPMKITNEFKGINEPIKTSFLFNKNTIVFLSGEKALNYNLNTTNSNRITTQSIDSQFDPFFKNASCVIPYTESKFVVFKKNVFAMYDKIDKKLSPTYKIGDYLPSFFEDINAGTTWGHDPFKVVNNSTSENINSYIYYFFKGNKYIKYRIKKQNRQEIFGNGHIFDGEFGNDITEKVWPGITKLINGVDDELTECPPGYELESNKVHCKNKNGDICTLNYNSDKSYRDCKNLCDKPTTSTGGIKYNELVAFKIYPNNYLGKYEYPVKWNNKSVFIIEPEEGCIKSNSDNRMVRWGDRIKLKSIYNQDYLSLSSSNESNVYQIQKSETFPVLNEEYVSDTDKFQLCIEFNNGNCYNKFRNGINDKNGLIEVNRITTAQYSDQQTSITTDDILSSKNDVMTNRIDSYKSDYKKNDFVAENENYCMRNGHDYRGTVSQTVSGKKCVEWNKKHIITQSDIENDGLGNHNYCRNPKKDKDSAWCYTDNNGKVWEKCNIGPVDENCAKSMNNQYLYENQYIDTFSKNNPDNQDNQGCPDKYTNKDSDIECYTDPTGSDYKGTVNWTKDHLQCSKWPEQYRNIYADKNIGDHNYCRNPDNSFTPWCFVDDKNKPVRDCMVGKPQTICKPSSSDELEQYSTEDGSDYRGHQITTAKGNKCIYWNDPRLGDGQITEWNHNYCRNPTNNLKEMPWCYVKNGIAEFCNIKKNTNTMCGFNKRTNKILCAFAIPEANKYYLFKNIIVNNTKYIMFNIISNEHVKHESKLLGIVNDITWPGLTFNENIDATFYDNNIIYFFNGANVIKYDITINHKKNVTNVKGQMNSIGSEFPNLDFKSNINCIISLGNGDAFIIKNNNYVKFNFRLKKQYNSIPALFGKDVINNLTMNNIDAAITLKNNNNSLYAYLFRDNFYVQIENIGLGDDSLPNQVSPVPLLIQDKYRAFWKININNPIFNKQEILINKNINILDMYQMVSKIKKNGGFSSYMQKTKTNIYDIAQSFDITIEELLELVESKLFDSDPDDKALTYNDPLF
jgi:hypothetical protein